MSVLTQMFGGKYNDAQLVATVERAIEVDPLLQDPSALMVTSKKGVIQLTGKVHSASEKARVENLICTTLSNASLKYDQIVNDIW